MKQKNNIIIIDDDSDILIFLKTILEIEYNVHTAKNGIEAIGKIENTLFDVIILDVMLPDISGIEVLERIKKIELRSHIPVILITAHGNINMAVKAMDKGAFYFLPKDDLKSTLSPLIKRALESSQLQRELAFFRNKNTNIFSTIIAGSPSMKKIFQRIIQIAPKDVSVLITGSTGTGKELIAKAIHDNSMRQKNSFVAVNCGAIPETLLESNLFGHVKGSFIGAIKDRKGLFMEANNGTLFLDEISSFPFDLQVKLLRTLQENEIQPVGSDKTEKINVRIIAASNKDLQKMMEVNSFREDLFYRLNVVSIKLPDLKERIEDIPLLSQYFLEKHNNISSDIKGFAKETLSMLMGYDWPGNIRELENAIKHAMVTCKNNLIYPEDLPESIKNNYSFSLDNSSLYSLKELEKQHIVKILKYTNFNYTRTSKILGIDRKSLSRKIKKNNLSIPL